MANGLETSDREPSYGANIREVGAAARGSGGKRGQKPTTK